MLIPKGHIDSTPQRFGTRRLNWLASRRSRSRRAREREPATEAEHGKVKFSGERHDDDGKRRAMQGLRDAAEWLRNALASGEITAYCGDFTIARKYWQIAEEARHTIIQGKLVVGVSRWFQLAKHRDLTVTVDGAELAGILPKSPAKKKRNAAKSRRQNARWWALLQEGKAQGKHESAVLSEIVAKENLGIKPKVVSSARL